MKPILKAGALLFVVGALLAVAAPAIAVGLGMAPTYAAGAALLGHSASPLWMGCFFGAFGAIDAAVRPYADKLFGDAKPAATVAASPAPAQEKARGVASEVAYSADHAARLEAEQSQGAQRSV